MRSEDDVRAGARIIASDVSVRRQGNSLAVFVVKSPKGGGRKMKKFKQFALVGVLLAGIALFGGLGAACAAVEKTDDGATVASLMEIHTAALMGVPKKVATDSTAPLTCTQDSDCQLLKYWQADQCNGVVRCTMQTPWTTGVCETFVAQTCVDPSTTYWPLGIGCNFAPAPDGSCDDGNACTTDYCNPYFYGGQGGCAHPQAAGENSCGTDGCVFKQPMCLNYAVNTQTCGDFLKSFAGHVCDDGNACTSGDACGIDPADNAFKCVGGAAPDCDDKNPCTDDSCDVVKGCVTLPNAATCDDGNPCTTGDTCGGGKCVVAQKVCDDGNPCTDDSCDTQTGNCVFANNAATCDDGNACTSEKCEGGLCTKKSISCDDGSGCTDDSCDPAIGCVHVNNVAACDDGNACTMPDACSGGVCMGQVVNCDDKNPCSDDSCDPAKGCVNAPNTAACDDGNACTSGDVCSGGKCAGGAPPNCDDGNACTDDSCDPAKGCVNAPNTAACDDGNACTVGDACSGGKCAGGAPPNCNDGNACTDDSCDPAKGCVNAPNTAACDDGNKCTSDDVCSGGTCAGQNVCTPESVACGDGVDNDKNGLVDCQDAACAGDPLCAQQVCKAVGSVQCGSSWSVDLTGLTGVVNKWGCAPPTSVPGAEKLWQFVSDGDYTVEVGLSDPSDKHIVVVAKGKCTPSSCEAIDYKVVAVQVAKGETLFVGVDTLVGALPSAASGMTLALKCTPLVQ
ncbi:hypothetical protein HY839_04755 [Candidatus Azambacteria bacterium]|nr:hypothetical protein [Candidatus Azambacteria bacterium]